MINNTNILFKKRRKIKPPQHHLKTKTEQKLKFRYRNFAPFLVQ